MDDGEWFTRHIGPMPPRRVGDKRGWPRKRAEFCKMLGTLHPGEGWIMVETRGAQHKSAVRKRIAHYKQHGLCSPWIETYTACSGNLIVFIPKDAPCHSTAPLTHHSIKSRLLCATT